jgi:hypothetical protein
MESPDVKGVRLDDLRRRIAAIPARGAAARVPSPLPLRSGVASAPEPVARAHVEMSAARRDEPLPGRSQGGSLPVPAALAGLLPVGGLARGSVVEYSGAGSLLIGLLAAVTEDGGHAVVVGLPRLGLLAAAEMGAQLDRLAVVPDPGPDPLGIASILLDGLDLVVLGLAGAAVPPAKTRVLAARARVKGAALVVTGGAWSGPALRIEARVTGYGGLGRGSGRLRTMRLNVRVRDRSSGRHTGLIDLIPCGDGVEWVVSQSDSPVSPLPDGRCVAS